MVEFYENHEFHGEPLIEIYQYLDFDWSNNNPFDSNEFSAIMKKKVIFDDKSEFEIEGKVLGDMEIFINNEKIFDNHNQNEDVFKLSLDGLDNEQTITVKYKSNLDDHSELQLLLNSIPLDDQELVATPNQTIDLDTITDNPPLMENIEDDIQVNEKEPEIIEETDELNNKYNLTTFSSELQTFSTQNNWKATFYPNKNFTGTPIKKEYPKLDLSWGSGSPDKSIPNDNFTAIFTKEIITEKSEFYRIKGRADDGIRVYVDGKLVVDQWKDGVNPFHKDLLLTKGKHNITVEYYEGKYSAAIKVDIDPISNLIGNDWEAAYFDNPNFESTPLMTQVKNLDLNWKNGSPSSKIPNDNFTATFHKKLNITEAGEFVFSGRSDDGIRVYVNDKLIINKWNEGVNQYNETVSLSKGNHLIRVEYLEKRYGAAIKLDINPVSKTDWSATYYPNKNFTGTPYKTTHKHLNLNWGSGSPAPQIPVDRFSAIFERKFQVPEDSDYLFSGRGDDGIRIYVDGKLIVDRWRDGVNNFEAITHLKKGEHTIKVEYYEEKYSAAIRVEYAPIEKVSLGSWTAKYYPNKNFTGTPVTRNIGEHLDLNWGSGSPAASIPNDNFSAIFEKEVTLANTGTYQFIGRADDGYRIYVDGKLVINGWATGVNQINHLVDLSAGKHIIRVEYFDEKYSAAIKLDFHEVESQDEQWLATYYPNKNLTGLAVKRYEGSKLNLSWGHGSPATSIPVDNFSATFEKTIDIPTNGLYELFGRADDGVCVYVDGKKVIDQWKSGLNNFNHNIQLTAGKHKVKIEYFEEKFSAAISLDLRKARQQVNYINTNYDSTYQEALNKQMATKDPPPQTDLYGRKNAFVRAADITLGNSQTTINTDGVRLRTSPYIQSNNISTQVNKGTVIKYIKDVTGTSVSGSTKWYEIQYQNKTLYVHSSLVSISSAATTNKKTNVHETASANSHVYGSLNSGVKVNIIKQGTTWHEISYGTWRNAKKADVEKYFNPNNFTRGTRDYYQFLLLKGSSNVNENEINQKILAGKGVLAGKASAFTKASKEHNINEIYLISHALLESGNGTSTLAKGVRVDKVDGKSVTPRIVYNMYGIGAYDKCPVECGSEYAYKQGWFTVDAAIIGGAKWIGRNYISTGQDTLYKMKWNPANPGVHQYATDIGWAVKQTSRLYQFYSQLEAYNITFDVPKYK